MKGDKITLNAFMDIWTRKKHTVYLCPDKYYDDMFNLIDEINDDEKKIDEIREYAICAFIPNACDFIIKYYLKDKLVDAKVEHFYIGDGYVIVWIEEDITESKNKE